MRLLDGEAIRECRIEGRQLPCFQVCGEIGILACGVRVCANAVHQVYGVGLQIVETDAAALVAVRNCTALLQPPVAGGADRAIDTARAGRGCRHDAGIVFVEAGRNLDHQRDIAVIASFVREGDVLVARDLAVAQRCNAIVVDVRPEQRAVTAVGRDIDQRTVVRMDRVAAQFRRSRVCRVRIDRRGSLNPGLAQSGGQQVVADAVIGHLLNRPEEFRLLVEFRCSRATACRQQPDSHQRCDA